MEANEIQYAWDTTHMDTPTHKALNEAVTICSYSKGVVYMNQAYRQYHATNDDSVTSAFMSFVYDVSKDNDNNSLFQFGFVLPPQWIQRVIQSTETQSDHNGWCVNVDMQIAPQPDCVYKACVFLFTNGTWEVVQDDDYIMDQQQCPFTLDSVRICTACSLHQNKNTSKKKSKQNPSVFVLGFTRVDLGQLPSDHVFHINTLELRIIDNEIQAVQKQQSRLALAHKTHILASIRDHQQLQQPIAILSREVFGSMCNDAQTHAILQFSVRGTCQHIRHMQILFQPIHNQTTSTEAPPSLYPVYINDNTFACSTNHLFSTLVESIEVRFIVDTGEYLEIDIHDLQLVPVAIQNQVTRLYDDNESESVGFHTIDTIKKEVNDLRQIAQVIQKTPGPTGYEWLFKHGWGDRCI